MYSSGSTLHEALTNLQLIFSSLQHNLAELKLGLNDTKAKLMKFTHGKSIRQLNFSHPYTHSGTEVKKVSEHKYLGIIIGRSLSFTIHVQEKNKRKLKLRLGQILPVF